MKIKGFESEEEFIDAYTAFLNSKKEGKGDAWKEKWTTTRKPYYHDIFEKVFRSELNRKHVVIGTKLSNSEYILKTSILNCEYGKFSGNIKSDVIYTFKFELFNINTRTLVFETEDVISVGEFQNGVGFRPYPGVPTPDPWDNYTIDAKTRQSYSRVAKSLALLLQPNIEHKTVFTPILMAKYNIGSHVDNLTPSFQVAVEYIFAKRFSTQLELGYINEAAFIEFDQMFTLSNRNMSGWRIRNEYRIYPLQENEYKFYIALDYLYKNYNTTEVKEDPLYETTLWEIDKHKVTHAGHFKVGLQFYIIKRLVIDVYGGIGLRKTSETQVSPNHVSSTNDNNYNPDYFSDILLPSGILGVKIGYILMKKSTF